MDKEKLLTYSCPVEATIDVIGGKYKMQIIWYLQDKVLRYNELQKAIPQATPKMLSQQLKELIADGLVHRKLYPVVPPKTEYSLTELGKTLVPVVDVMCEWGEKYYEHFGVPNPCDAEE